MSRSMNESVWGRWLPHPGNLLTAAGQGGWLLSIVGMVFGAPLVTVGVGCLFGAVRTPGPGAAAFALGVGAMASAIGVLLLMSAEAAVAGVSVGGRSRARPVALLAARASLVLAVVVGFGLMLAHVGRSGGPMFYVRGAAIYDPTMIGDQSGEVFDRASIGAGGAAALWTIVPALVVLGFLARSLVRLGTTRVRTAVLAWAGVTAALSLVAVTGWVVSLVGWHSLPGASTAWRGALWTVAVSGLAAALAALAQRRLALWDHADRWRDATLTPDLRIEFADGSGARPASDYFRGYVGPVVVMPTAEAAGSVFRGDGAPADAWVVPGTRAALEESVRCVRAMARITVAAVGLMAMAPLAVWLVSLVG